ncbi:hypothetical protein M433DRAFT_145490 [Acidomyces richmondensis BFW]|nr:MAG: hypothetical protein FE78DRAFT_82189 [Acidomyces sp. 'richmondensis']KYG43806.1 hypothetical protein M433DRAFT_145490 [Acidomyces richmondensis BFW]
MIDSVREDIDAIKAFYDGLYSPARLTRLRAYCVEKIGELELLPYDDLDIESRTDYLLLKMYLDRCRTEQQQYAEDLEKLHVLVEPFASTLAKVLARRQKVVPTSGQDAASALTYAHTDLEKKYEAVCAGDLKLPGKEGRFVAYRATQIIEGFQAAMREWFGFYNGYDPLMIWWIKAPYEELLELLQNYISAIRRHLIGIDDGQCDAIVGQPAGLENISFSLATEFIPYNPGDILQIASREYDWCMTEMLNASHDLGYGTDWKSALDHVKNMYVEPGQQIHLVHELAQEAIEYVTAHDLVTVPRIAKECWRTYMISPARQKENPFFLGGPYIEVSYPTDTMGHAEKMMSMRGNSRPLSRSTVLHELIPGHHLQFHMMARHRPYRCLFQTPFWMEGWAFYWEMILWDRGFAQTPEEKIGMLFWRMHRCARITFSLKFHLGEWTPQECIEHLIDKVGHERATAEGEVRRSFNGEYSPLYQAGYMLGALQIYALRKELVEQGGWRERDFHDRFLKEGVMPIELLRALLKGEKLDRNHKAGWRFYNL